MKLDIGNHSEQVHLAVTELGKASLFLGYDWLQKHNPIIDWSKPTLSLARCHTRCGRIYWREEPEEIEETFDDGLGRILFVDLEEEAIRREEKVVRTRQNTNDPDKE